MKVDTNEAYFAGCVRNGCLFVPSTPYPGSRVCRIKGSGGSNAVRLPFFLVGNCQKYCVPMVAQRRRVPIPAVVSGWLSAAVRLNTIGFHKGISDLYVLRSRQAVLACRVLGTGCANWPVKDADVRACRLVEKGWGRTGGGLHPIVCQNA